MVLPLFHPKGKEDMGGDLERGFQAPDAPHTVVCVCVGGFWLTFYLEAKVFGERMIRCLA